MADNNNQNGLFIGWIWKEVRAFFSAGFEYVWAGFEKIIPTFVKHLVEAPIADGLIATDEEWSAMVERFKGWGILDDTSAQNIMGLKELKYPYNMILYYYTNYTLMAQYVSQYSYVISSDLRHTLNEQESPELPTHYDILNAAFIAPEKTERIREILRQQGYAKDDIDLLFLNLYRTIDEGTIRELYLRGVFTKDQLYLRMRELGYTDTRTQEIIQTWEVIPGPTDLITMAYRGSFDPESRRKWPWAFDTPSAFVEWAGKLGISKDWAEKYWYMHWTQPGVREMFEMMHRGAITADDLDHTLKVIGYSDYWIEKLKTITYAPYTRVDVRRMHDLGVIGDEELIRSYMDLGYDEEKARGMAEFTVRYNMESERTLTRTQVIDAYQENLLDKEGALSELELMGYSRARAEFLLAFEEYKEDRDYRDTAVDNVRDRYQNNLITKQEAYDKLSALDVDGRRIEVLIDKWSLNKFEDRKVPSKTDLDKFLRNGIIDNDRYWQEMQKLGYNFEYIEWYKKLVDKKKAG